MKVMIAFVLLAAATPLPAAAQATRGAPGASKPAVKILTTKPAPVMAEKPPTPGSPRAVYAAQSEQERIAVQSDLIWTGDYNGIANGDFGENSVAAVRSFQKRNAFKETGILNPDERGKLAAGAKTRQARVGWRMVNDMTTGARIGIPGTLLHQLSVTQEGSRWQSAKGEVVVSIFRSKGESLAAAFERQKKTPPDRRVEYNVLRQDFFVVSGLQGLKKFYVRGQIKDNEVRGMTVAYDQAMEGIMDPIVVAMSGTFQPFWKGDIIAAVGPPPRRKVEYATGLVVGAQGFILAEREATEDCQTLVIAGQGNVERVADDKDTGLALLRLYGVHDLTPMPFGQSAAAANVTLVGIADPQTQAGGMAVTTPTARLADMARLDPAPAAGFSGAAALDPQARFAGVVGLAPQLATNTAATPTAPPATFVPADTVRAFLTAQGVTPPDGAASLDAAKAAALRVICVRK